jgi:hypothetical protein
VTADPRLTAAAEFLAHARRRKIAELPPSVLAREDAELRRQLGIVLHAVTGTGDLRGHDDIIGQALRDGIRYQREHREVEDWPGQIGLYRWTAAVFGLPLAGAETAPAGRVLSPAELTVVLGALDHAEQLLRERAAAYCDDCATHPAGACEEHVDQLDQADDYQVLAARLGGAP